MVRPTSEQRRLDTAYSTVTWSADGSRVTKTRSGDPRARRRFRHELRVNLLLRSDAPRLPTPRLIDHDVQHRRLTFDAVDGDPIGPKYPTTFTTTDLDDCLSIERAVQTFAPRRRWLPRINVARRISLAHRSGLLNHRQAAAIHDLLDRNRVRLRFAHGDLIARNVLRSPSGPMVIDWEWAGLYPHGYDLAVLWFSLVDTPDGRDQLEAHLETPQLPFLLSALVVQLWHLQWFVTPEFQTRHLQTRDELLHRLLGRVGHG